MVTYQLTGLGADATEDVQVSLKNYFKTQWALTTPLNKEKIRWSTGWNDLSSPLQIHFRHDIRPIIRRVTIGGASSIRRYDDFVNVHVFLNKQSDNSEPTELGKIYRELERIAGENITALLSTKGFSYFEFSRPMNTLPQEDSQPSIWHGTGTIEILYHKVAV